jgi:hypothetical protein
MVEWSGSPDFHPGEGRTLALHDGPDTLRMSHDRSAIVGMESGGANFDELGFRFRRHARSVCA